MTTPSATRIYRSTGEPAVETARLRLGPGRPRVGPRPPIPPPARPSGSPRREVADGARLILIDAFAAGRVARGEAWRFALLDSTLTVRDARGLLLHDRFVLRGGADWDRLGLAEGRPYFATIVLIAEAGLDAFIADLPDALPMDAATVGAARLPRRGALVRCLAPDAPRCRRPSTRLTLAAPTCSISPPVFASSSNRQRSPRRHSSVADTPRPYAPRPR